MRFLSKKYRARKGQTVLFRISEPTTVKLISEAEFKRYKNSMPYKYYGGEFSETEVFIPVPSNGVWYAVVEKGTKGNEKNITASCKLIPGVFTNQNAPKLVTKKEEPKALETHNEHHETVEDSSDDSEENASDNDSLEEDENNKDEA